MTASSARSCDLMRPRRASRKAIVEGNRAAGNRVRAFLLAALAKHVDGLLPHFCHLSEYFDGLYIIHGVDAGVLGRGSQGRTCRVKKDVRCVEACRFGGGLPHLKKKFPIKKGKGKGKGLNPRLLKYPYDQKRYREWQQCGEKYCEGRYGAMACKESAMTF